MASNWELNIEDIDQDDPFEFDRWNMSHLAKHALYTYEDVYDAFLATRFLSMRLTSRRCS